MFHKVALTYSHRLGCWTLKKSPDFCDFKDYQEGIYNGVRKSVNHSLKGAPVPCPSMSHEVLEMQEEESLTTYY